MKGVSSHWVMDSHCIWLHMYKQNYFCIFDINSREVFHVFLECHQNGLWEKNVQGYFTCVVRSTHIWQSFHFYVHDYTAQSYSYLPPLLFLFLSLISAEWNWSFLYCDLCERIWLFKCNQPTTKTRKKEEEKKVILLVMLLLLATCPANSRSSASYQAHRIFSGRWQPGHPFRNTQFELYCLKFCQYCR